MKSNKPLIYLGICFSLILICIYLIKGLLKNQNQNDICLSNLQKLGSGFYSYALDHEGALPSIKDFKKNKTSATWINSLWPYIKEKKRFSCPAADKIENSQIKLSSGDFIECSYGMFVDAPKVYGLSLPLLADSTQGDIKKVYSNNKLSNEGFKIDKDKMKGVYTQLSFYYCKNGCFDPLGNARHGHNIHVLMGNGSVNVCNVKIAYFK